jgi:hypothetical protein
VTKFHKMRVLISLLGMLISTAAFAQNPTAQGTINATLINASGISLVFDSSSSGVALGGSGSGTATLNFGTISAYNAVPAGVTRTGPTGGNFTVSTQFNVKVTMGGLNSQSYTLSAQLATAASTGLTYTLDSTTLSTSSQTVQTNGTYASDVPHTLYLQISTAPVGAGGPPVGALTETINFTATAN